MYRHLNNDFPVLYATEAWFNSKRWQQEFIVVFTCSLSFSLSLLSSFSHLTQPIKHHHHHPYNPLHSLTSVAKPHTKPAVECNSRGYVTNPEIKAQHLSIHVDACIMKAAQCVSRDTAYRWRLVDFNNNNSPFPQRCDYLTSSMKLCQRPTGSCHSYVR